METFQAPCRGKWARRNIWSDNPDIKKYAVKWVRGHLKSRMKNSKIMSVQLFMTHMNQHFTKTNVLDYKGEILQWKKTAALAQMHKLGMECGVLKAGQCDNHERSDVKEARTKCVNDFAELKKRMHLWFEDEEDGETRCVDDYSIGTGDGELDRSRFGEFGGYAHPDADCIEEHENPNCRPLLLIMQDEVCFRAKVLHHKVWQEGKKKTMQIKRRRAGKNGQWVC